jgi:hypothetical protein
MNFKKKNKRRLAYLCCIIGTILFFLIKPQEYISPAGLFNFDLIGTIYGFLGLGLWVIAIKLFLSESEDENVPHDGAEQNNDEVISVIQDDTQEDKTPNEPFLALLKITDDGYYPLYLVNPTDIAYKDIKQLTGAFCSGDDCYIETSKKVSNLPELGPKTFIKIEDIDYRDRDYVIWYDFDFIQNNTDVKYKIGSVPKYSNDSDKEYVGYGINQYAWVLKLDDRTGNSINEIEKTIIMGSRYITYNEDGSIKEEILNDKNDEVPSEKQKHVTCVGSVLGGVYCKCTNPECDFTSMYCFENEMAFPAESSIKKNTRVCHNCGFKVYMEEKTLECPNCKMSGKNIGEGAECQKCKKGYMYEVDRSELKAVK